MAMPGIALVMTLEGIVGNVTGASQLWEPQSIPIWLRAMKENIFYASRNIEDSFVLDIYSDLDDSVEEVQSAPTWVYGFLGKNLQAGAMIIQMWDAAAATPGTTSVGSNSSLYLPLAAATTPTVGGVVTVPYEYFATECQITATTAADWATGSTTNLVSGYVIRRDE